MKGLLRTLQVSAVFVRNRVEKSSRHVSMVAKKPDLDKSSMAAMSISALASFFAKEPKSINRGAVSYTHLTLPTKLEV